MNQASRAALVHLPQLAVGGQLPRIAYRLLPATLTKSLQLLGFDKADAVIVSGDTVSKPKRETFKYTTRVIQQCLSACSCSRAVVVPGDLDMQNSSDHEDLQIRALRADQLESFNALNIQRALLRSQLFQELVQSALHIPYSLNPFPIVEVQLKDPFPISIIGLDSALFSIGESSDRQRLVVGNKASEEFLDTALRSTLNIVTLHHHPDWLAKSQNRILKLLFERCHLLLYSHSAPTPPHYNASRIPPESTAMLGPVNGGKEFQILDFNPESAIVHVHTYKWSESRLDWAYFMIKQVTVQYDRLKVYSPQLQKGDSEMEMDSFDIRYPLVQVLLEVGRFAMTELGERWRARRAQSSSSRSRDETIFVDLAGSVNETDASQLHEWLRHLDENRVDLCRKQIEEILSFMREHDFARYAEKRQQLRAKIDDSAIKLRQIDREKDIAAASKDLTRIMQECLGLEIERQEIS